MGFSSSGAKIYKKMRVEGLMRDVARNDVVSLLSPFESKGFRWHNGTGKMQRVGGQEAASYEVFDTPWCHARHLVGKHCGLDHQCIFNMYNIIHPRCMSCWKTCMGLKNFDELMTWHKIQLNEIDFAAKCGIELRDYTPKFYGAYHYANSLDEGREMYEKVFNLAKKHLSEETAEGVILKRACTEYEMEKPNSASWYLTEEQEEVLRKIELYVEYPMPHRGQNNTLAHPHVQMRWLLYAHMNNDMSYLPYNNNIKLFPGYQTYHEGDIQGIKHDMAVLTTQAKHNIDPKITNEFLAGTSDFASTHDLTVDKFNPALGFDTKSPYGIMDYSAFADVDPDVIGEGDNEPEQTE